jgi:hypothetical protein
LKFPRALFVAFFVVGLSRLRFPFHKKIFLEHTSLSEGLNINNSRPVSKFLHTVNMVRFLTTGFVPGANPTIASYNAIVVNIYSATSSLAHFENKNSIFYF